MNLLRRVEKFAWSVFKGEMEIVAIYVGVLGSLYSVIWGVSLVVKLFI